MRNKLEARFFSSHFSNLCGKYFAGRLPLVAAALLFAAPVFAQFGAPSGQSQRHAGRATSALRPNGANERHRKNFGGARAEHHGHREHAESKRAGARRLRGKHAGCRENAVQRKAWPAGSDSARAGVQPGRNRRDSGSAAGARTKQGGAQQLAAEPQRHNKRKRANHRPARRSVSASIFRGSRFPR